METKPEPKGQSRKAAATPNVEVRTNPVLAEVEPAQPYDPRRYAIMVGYIGVVTDNVVQVYPQLDLGTYFKLPRKAIVFAEPAVPGQKSSPTKLVVDASARVLVVKFSVRSIEAGFLSGSIAASHLGSALPYGSAGTEIPPEMTATVDPCYIRNSRGRHTPFEVFHSLRYRAPGLLLRGPHSLTGSAGRGSGRAAPERGWAGARPPSVTAVTRPPGDVMVFRSPRRSSRESREKDLPLVHGHPRFGQSTLPPWGVETNRVPSASGAGVTVRGLSGGHAVAIRFEASDPCSTSTMRSRTCLSTI